MKKYRVYGNTVVTVIKEVWANSESEAYDKAYNQLSSLTAYCGNGGDDKLIGVDNENESVFADDKIEYDDIEMIDDDPNYRECPECHEQLEAYDGDNGEKFWKCEYGCGTCYDENYNEVDPSNYYDEDNE